VRRKIPFEFLVASRQIVICRNSRLFENRFKAYWKIAWFSNYLKSRRKFKLTLYSFWNKFILVISFLWWNKILSSILSDRDIRCYFDLLYKHIFWVRNHFPITLKSYDNWSYDLSVSLYEIENGGVNRSFVSILIVLNSSERALFMAKNANFRR
jgi:hypothetical protein